MSEVTINAGGGSTPQKIGANSLIVSGKKAVATVGTAVLLLTAGTVTRTVIIKAEASNTGIIYVGNVSDDVASTNGLELAAGEAVSMDIDNSKKAIYLDTSVNTDGVSFIYLV